MDVAPRLRVVALIVCGLIATGVLVSARLSVHPVAVLFAAATIVLAFTKMALSLLANARQLEISRREALTDSLTGLQNRRKLLADLEVAIAAGHKEPRLLVLFDLNGFKTYNDSFGHPAGDALLRRLAARLAAVVAPAGEAYRLGGDEFCVLLPATERDLDRVAQALCESGEGFDVTSAYGVAAIPDDATTVSAALRLADERLYADKGLARFTTTKGRDRSRPFAVRF